MAEKELSDDFECSAEAYWDELFFDPEYNSALFLGRLKFEKWELVSLEEQGSTIRRVVDAVPPMPDLPGALKRVIKNGIGYREVGIFDKATRRYSLTATPASLADKLTISGETRTEPRGDGRCARIHLARAEARIFGIGSLLENRLLEDMAKSYSKAAAFSNDWLKTRRR